MGTSGEKVIGRRSSVLCNTDSECNPVTNAYEHIEDIVQKVGK